MEKKQGLSSFLTFGTKSVDPKILEALLVGRREVVDELTAKIRNIVLEGLNHQVIIIGARGTGKTHLLRILYHRAKEFIDEEKLSVAYFAEEEYGISGYLDFLVRIINAFIRWDDDKGKILKQKVEILQETPSEFQEDTAERIINEYIDQRPLLILTENFNDTLNSLKRPGQSKLRNWLYENERISIIATSQALSDDFGKEDRPFYGFFDEIFLKKLDYQQSFDLLRKLAQIEGRHDVLKHLELKGEGQVRAIYDLVKGNHRLLVTFYEFLKADLLSSLSNTFIKTLNDLKPYYETFIRFLPPQQQKILRFIALKKTPQQGTDISKQCFIDPRSLSKQLNMLVKKNLIDVLDDPEDRRNKLYDVSEPLLRISIEIGEHREGISALFVDFLAIYYDENELNNQKRKFIEFVESCEDPFEKSKYRFEIEARERAMEIRHKNLTAQEDLIIQLFSEEKFDNALQKLEVLYSGQELDQFYHYMKGFLQYELSDYKGSVVNLEEVIKDSEDPLLFYVLGKSYAQLSDDRANNYYSRAVELEPSDRLYTIGFARHLSSLNQVKQASQVIDSYLSIEKADEEILLLYSSVLFRDKQYDSVIKVSEEAMKLNPDSIAIISLGLVYHTIGKTKKGINLLHEGVSNLVKHIVQNASEDNEEWQEESYFQILNIIVFILRNDNALNKDKVTALENAVSLWFQSPPEAIQLVITFLKVFNGYVFDNNEKALFELPKEQREFFKKEVLLDLHQK